MSFAKQLVGAVLVVGLGVGGLWALRQGQAEPAPDAASGEQGEVDQPAPSTAEPAPLPEGKGIDHAVRSLVPGNALLVADFRGDLSGAAPFAGVGGYCEAVPSPERMGLGLLPGKEEPELLLVAPAVSDTFWGCARDRIVRAGGNAIAQNDEFEVLQSPAGVVARGPGGAMAFLAGGGAALETVLEALSGVGDSAAHDGVHAGLYRRMHPDLQLAGDRGATARNLPTGASSSELDLTLALPPSWLSSVGPEAEVSPLRHVRAGFFTLSPDGSAQGGVDCVEPGCAEVAAFFERAASDLSKRLPAATAAALREGLRVEHIPASGRIVLRFERSEVSLASLLGGLLGRSGLSF